MHRSSAVRPSAWAKRSMAGVEQTGSSPARDHQGRDRDRGGVAGIARSGPWPRRRRASQPIVGEPIAPAPTRRGQRRRCGRSARHRAMRRLPSKGWVEIERRAAARHEGSPRAERAEDPGQRRAKALGPARCSAPTIGVRGDEPLGPAASPRRRRQRDRAAHRMREDDNGGAGACDQQLRRDGLEVEPEIARSGGHGPCGDSRARGRTRPGRASRRSPPRSRARAARRRSRSTSR